MGKKRIAVGSDERTHLTGSVQEELRKLGFEAELHGALSDEPTQWPEVARVVAESVATGRSDEGILFCWTGTGVCMAANKVPGVRAALCADAETARGARKWNDANVLCMSLRLTSPVIAREILEAWFSTQPDATEADNIRKVKEIDQSRLETSHQARR